MPLRYPQHTADQQMEYMCRGMCRGMGAKGAVDGSSVNQVMKAADKTPMLTDAFKKYVGNFTFRYTNSISCNSNHSH
jgi:hypothetical protein